MDWKKIAPWNWFKEEESPTRASGSLAHLDVPADPLNAMRREMERDFHESFRRFFPCMPSRAIAGPLSALLRPSVDISEGKQGYTVRAELPGVDREDVSLEVDGRTLVIRAEKRQENEEDDEGYHCVERSYGAVQRVLSLPDDADGDAITAKFKNGVLKLRIPKHAARAARGNSIEIHEG